VIDLVLLHAAGGARHRDTHAHAPALAVERQIAVGGGAIRSTGAPGYTSPFCCAFTIIGIAVATFACARCCYMHACFRGGRPAYLGTIAYTTCIISSAYSALLWRRLSAFPLLPSPRHTLASPPAYISACCAYLAILTLPTTAARLTGISPVADERERRRYRRHLPSI